MSSPLQLCPNWQWKCFQTCVLTVWLSSSFSGNASDFPSVVQYVYTVYVISGKGVCLQLGNAATILYWLRFVNQQRQSVWKVWFYTSVSTIKTDLFQSSYLAFELKIKRNVVRTLIIFRDRQSTIQKISERAFHWCGWPLLVYHGKQGRNAYFCYFSRLDLR